MVRDQTPLTSVGLQSFLLEHPGWELTQVGELQRTWEFPSFLAGIAFVQEVAAIAERHDHHPDLDIRYRKVCARLFTHDANGLTTRELKLAVACDRLARQPRPAATG